MDKEILDLLKSMHKDITAINTKVDRIEKKLDGVVEQTADLTEFRTETKAGIEAIQKDVGKLTNVTKDNCYEIANLKMAK